MEVANNEVILSLGSDLGDRVDSLETALKKISLSLGRISVVSSIYETMPLEFKSDTTFYNLCLILNTNFSSEKLLKALQRIENEVGRQKKAPKLGYESRIIDIDIIYYNNSTISTENLKVPHPKFRDRNFVLIPLAEIAPIRIDPVSNLTSTQLLENCTDDSNAIKINHHFTI